MLIDGILTQTPLIPALASFGPKVYEDTLPRGYAFPAIVVHTYGGDQDSQLDGPAGVREDKVQFDCYGRSSLQARQVAEAIREFYLPYLGTLPDGTVVQLCKFENSMSMPRKADGDTSGNVFRKFLQLRFFSVA